MKRLFLLAFLVACRKDRVNPATETEAGVTVQASELPDGFAVGKPIVIGVEEAPAALEEIGEGSWVVFGPHGDLALFGDTKVTTLWPRKEKLRLANIRGARFSPDGEKLVVWTREPSYARAVSILAVNDLHTIVTFPSVDDPIWTTRGTVAYRNQGQIFEVSPTSGATPKLVGPPQPHGFSTGLGSSFRVAPDLSYWITVDTGTAERVDLVTGEATELFKRGKSIVVVSPDGSQACGHVGGMGNSGWIMCGHATVARSPLPAEFGFLTPTKLWLRYQPTGDFRIVDFETKSISPLDITVPATRLTPLPGGKLAIASEHFDTFDRPRGIIDFEKKKLVRIVVDDFKQHGLRGDGSPDDAAIGLVWQEAPDPAKGDDGPGKLYRIRARR